MGDITIRLRANRVTGEREVVVSYDSDEDQTSLEHERRHREIVEQLVRDGIITRDQEDAVHYEPAAPRGAVDPLSQDA
ncbi:MAG: hypothetical protein HZB16_09660 [Armatimonadetes bacterium]|nr:hypothetical protein [Armatimonadota bacterium]